MELGENINENAEGASGQESTPETPKVGTLANPSAMGANPDLPGFTDKNLDDHWFGGKSDHSKEYLGFTKEQYAQRAIELLQSEATGNIDGYKAANGAIVRYDKTTFDFVKGMPSGIKSMFKPKRKAAYFADQLNRDGGTQND